MSYLGIRYEYLVAKSRLVTFFSCFPGDGKNKLVNFSDKVHSLFKLRYIFKIRYLDGESLQAFNSDLLGYKCSLRRHCNAASTF